MTELPRRDPSATLFTTNREWSVGLHLAQQFHARHGHSYIPNRLTVSGFPLGMWAAFQRKSFRSGLLNPTRKRLIDAALEWDWCFADSEWEEGIQRAWEFSARHGHSLPTSSHRTEDGYPLGWWLTKQRMLHRKGQLSAPRVACLEQLSGWSWNLLDAKWNAHYELLRRFGCEHGHVAVPRGYVVEGINLHSWYVNQRFLFKQYNGERQKKLSSLPGWSGINDRGERWDVGINHLTEFVRSHGHANVDYGHVCDDGYPLGGWVSAQRRAFRLGKLTPARQGELSKQPGWEWNPRHAMWSDGYEHLVRYVEEKGSATPPARFSSSDGFALGRWVLQQRTAHRLGRISPDVVTKLESLPGWQWSKSSTRWESSLQRLIDFVDDNGKLPPQNFVCEDGFRLGTWVDTQRKFYRAGKLPQGRITRLESFPWWRWRIRSARLP